MNEDNKAPVKLGITSHLAVDHGAAQNTPENVMPNINHRPVRVVYYPRLNRRVNEICERVDRACKG